MDTYIQMVTKFAILCLGSSIYLTMWVLCFSKDNVLGWEGESVGRSLKAFPIKIFAVNNCFFYSVVGMNQLWFISFTTGKFFEPKRTLINARERASESDRERTRESLSRMKASFTFPVDHFTFLEFVFYFHLKLIYFSEEMRAKFKL